MAQMSQGGYAQASQALTDVGNIIFHIDLETLSSAICMAQASIKTPY
jgi:hypothetical protein